jgi:hypothetical protein
VVSLVEVEFLDILGKIFTPRLVCEKLVSRLHPSALNKGSFIFFFVIQTKGLQNNFAL